MHALSTNTHGLHDALAALTAQTGGLQAALDTLDSRQREGTAEEHTAPYLEWEDFRAMLKERSASQVVDYRVRRRR